jgi:hypothetical protein
MNFIVSSFLHFFFYIDNLSDSNFHFWVFLKKITENLF